MRLEEEQSAGYPRVLGASKKFRIFLHQSQFLFSRLLEEQNDDQISKWAELHLQFIVGQSH
ncbi:hypothetical protein KXD40_004527 [Peronospora effusa]|nr:hypothetical protein KXD40_004527 [Peronospora effusa]